jgi:hypothetical protein
MLGLDYDVLVTEQHEPGQGHAEGMYCQWRRLSPVNVDGRQQEPHENRLESKRHEVVGTNPAKAYEKHVRDCTEIQAAREDEHTELTNAIATHFTSAYYSIGSGKEAKLPSPPSPKNRT